MINVCDNCGEYRIDKRIDPDRSVAICPICQHPHPFRLQPLYFVCGPSGSGKSAVCQLLTGQLTDLIPLDSDILWQPAFNQPEESFRNFFETWLRMAKNIGQSGKPALIFSAGGIPANVELCVERRYFSKVHYLAFVCDDDELAARLKQRPTWRGSRDGKFIDGQLGYNRWLKQNGPSARVAIDLLDTTDHNAASTAEAVRAWLKTKAAVEAEPAAFSTR